jgi:predicted ATPase
MLILKTGTTMQQSDPPPPTFIIFSGAPGAGKTSLLQQLARRGYPTQHELARQLIQQSFPREGQAPSRLERQRFAEALWAVEVDRWRALRLHSPSPGQLPLLVDRSWVDGWACCQAEGVEICVDPLKDLRLMAPRSLVLLLSPWKDIYVQDSERTQSWQEAVQSYTLCAAAYRRFGFPTMEVPQLPLPERASWVHSLLQAPRRKTR